MVNCRICNTVCKECIDFGKMPLANGFLSPAEFLKEFFFELKVGFCEHCSMFQLINQPDREQMFNQNYPFFSGTSKAMGVHFREFANRVIRDYLTDDDPFVVEIGSNDGIMLKHFSNVGIRHLGIEPSANVAKVAIDQGIKTIVEFFDEELAEKVVHEHGQANAFLGANVMCHIPYLHSVVNGIKILLKPDGIVMFEDPYLGDVIENTTYDQIYDEHTFLFSVHSIQYLFKMHGMEVIDIEPQETHGGSMRYVIAHEGARSVSENVHNQLEKEKKMGLHKPETYDMFRRNCAHSRDKLMALLNDIRSRAKSIVGYAATSKSTTIINYCGITTDHLDYICDTTPIKQGKYSPGAHIPIRPYEDFLDNYPDYALLFAYNHSKEIMAKEQKFIQQKGKWITYVPEVKIL